VRGNLALNAADATVGVVMCAYKTGERIRPTIDAILAQDYPNLKLYVIDDASGDDTPEIVRSYDDDRITLVENEKNVGVIGSRNRGLGLVDCAFVATCDHDDIWEPDKLSLQVRYMEEHPNCLLVGCYWTVSGGERNDGIRTVLHTDSDFLGWYLLHKNCLLHSGLLMRRSAVAQHKISYADGLQFADDWQLCLDFASHGEIGIISQPLVAYFVHGENWSLKAGAEMRSKGTLVLKGALEKLLDRTLTEDDAVSYFNVVANGQPEPSAERLLTVGRLMQDVAGRYSAARKLDAVSARNIHRACSDMWWRSVCGSAGIMGPGRLRLYRGTGLPSHMSIDTSTYALEWCKSVLKYIKFKLNFHL